MVLRMGLPDLCSIGDGYGVNVAVGVSEERGLAVIADGDGGLNGGLRFEGPPGAAGGGVECVNSAVFASDEEFSCERGRLPVGGGGTRISEGPFELERFDLVDGQRGGVGGLKASVVRIGTPASPDWGIGRRIEVTRTRAGNFVRRREAGGGEIVGDGFALLVGEKAALPFHASAFKSGEDRRLGHLAQGVWQWGLGVAIGAMANGAFLGED